MTNDLPSAAGIELPQGYADRPKRQSAWLADLQRTLGFSDPYIFIYTLAGAALLLAWFLLRKKR